MNQVSAAGEAKYGAMEMSPLDGATRKFIEDADTRFPVSWNDPCLKRIVRLRLISDPGFPYWDVSYCIGEMMDGTSVRVDLPFDQLPRRGFRGKIVEYAKKDGVYAQKLGIFDAISTLV